MTDSLIRQAQTGKLLIDRYPPRPGARRLRFLRLDETERALVVDTFERLLDGFYAHRPLKEAMYAADPVQRLRLLRARSDRLDDAAFHLELARVFAGLRDAHTVYIGPAALEGKVATLGFLVEPYGEPADQRYIVSKVTDPAVIGDRRFQRGVELLWWNGIPIDRAVDRHAEHETGGRPDARRARAVTSLTMRALQYRPPPDEYRVVVGYADAGGSEREVRLDWRVVTPGTDSQAGGTGHRERNRSVAVDPAAEIVRQAKKLLFAPDRWQDDRRRRRARTAAAPGDGLSVSVEDPFKDVITARKVRTSSGTFGYLRLWSFSYPDDVADEDYVREVVRLLGLLPDRGLIVDLRANPGGYIWGAERLLQLFTPHPVVPTRFSLLATGLTRAMAAAGHNEWLADWRASLDDAVATGERYSQPIPLTPPEICNDIGQVYGGPVVGVVDANTYSAGDLFSAGFVDNNLGILVTATAEATGAGGASVWEPGDVEQALLGTPYEVVALPAGIGYRLSWARATRAGDADGLPIEDVGVRGQRTYAMTKRDLVGTDPPNADLLNFCGKLLKAQPKTALRVEGPTGGPLQVETAGLDRLDVFVDGRPDGSLDVTDGPTKLDVRPDWDRLELVGYRDGELRQRRRLVP